ncbi:MAG TPA: PIN domain-containing protein [Candidatus Acidoferrales bacterium]|nr:PIN domain-containing protein [Candidatus Acidoferrales bacterium]
MDVLVDTSIWSLALRRRPGALSDAEQLQASELAELVRGGRARIIGVVRQELLSGIASRVQFENLRAALRAFPDEAIETDDYELAAEAGNTCRRLGIATSISDMLICAVSTKRSWSIFTGDTDYRAYARALKINLHEARATEPG